MCTSVYVAFCQHIAHGRYPNQLQASDLVTLGADAVHCCCLAHLALRSTSPALTGQTSLWFPGAQCSIRGRSCSAGSPLPRQGVTWGPCGADITSYLPHAWIMLHAPGCHAAIHHGPSLQVHWCTCSSTSLPTHTLPPPPPPFDLSRPASPQWYGCSSSSALLLCHTETPPPPLPFRPFLQSPLVLLVILVDRCICHHTLLSPNPPPSDTNT